MNETALKTYFRLSHHCQKFGISLFFEVKVGIPAHLKGSVGCRYPVQILLSGIDDCDYE